MPRYIRAILMKLDRIEERLDTISNAMSKGIATENQEIFEEFAEQLNDPVQLEQASVRLTDQAYRDRMVCKYIFLNQKS